jgi:hypothetical protein
MYFSSTFKNLPSRPPGIKKNLLIPIIIAPDTKKIDNDTKDKKKFDISTKVLPTTNI